jgi:predicted PhzF superfamily epimerase YddE/YHI9
VAEGDSAADFRLRCFPPAVEVDLCGHAMLAAAHCLADGALSLDLPAWPPLQIDSPPGLAAALGAAVEWVGRGGTNDVLAVVADAATVRD